MEERYPPHFHRFEFAKWDGQMPMFLVFDAVCDVYCFAVQVLALQLWLLAKV